jgi:hypothetical protein
MAVAGGWQGLPEFAVDPGSTRSRSIDVVLVRSGTREAIVVEIWDWFDDVGAGLRSLDAKVTAVTLRLAQRPGPTGRPWKIGAIYVVRDTRRNRLLITELGALFSARFRGSSHAWLKALIDPGHPLPAGNGLLWSDRTGANLRPSRLRGQV